MYGWMVTTVTVLEGFFWLEEGEGSQWWTVVNIWLQKRRGIYRVFKGLLDYTPWSQLNAF